MRSPAAIVDVLAAKVPGQVWLKSPVQGSPDDEVQWEDITFFQLSRAVHIMAHWLDLVIDPADKHEGRPVAFVGVNDIRYPVLMLASIKTGHKLLLLSTRNSKEGHISLLETTGCETFLFSEEFNAQISEVAANHHAPLDTQQVPAVSDLFHPTEKQLDRLETYASKTGNDIPDHETLMILHSSGSTGPPKPIPMKAGAFGVFDHIVDMPTPDGDRRNAHDFMFGSNLVLTGLPMFHVYGIKILSRSIYHQKPLVLLPGWKPPSAESVLSAIRETKPTGLIGVPSILEDIVHIPGGLNTLGTLECIIFGGAPLAPGAGHEISKVTTLINAIGSTETGPHPSLFVDDEECWEYFEWNPLSGLVMETVDSETSADAPKAAELVIKKRHDENSKYQFVFYNFPEKEEWRTNDLFEQHPSKTDLWRYIGRKDDILVLSNGENVNPVPFEKGVEHHPFVKSAMVVGAGRFHTGLIIDPSPQAFAFSSNLEEVIDNIWPVVEAANAGCQAHARVFRSMVLLSSPEKPFKRSPKGSIMRHATCKLYQKEIDALYHDDGGMANGSNGINGTKKDAGNSRYVVRKAAQAVLSSAAKSDVTDTISFFSLGMDSLQVLQLSKLLARQFSVESRRVFRMVYDNPTVAGLAQALEGDAKQATKPQSQKVVSREEKMSSLLHKYSKPVSKKRHEGEVVLITGTTGSLGTYLLHTVLHREGVRRVYCLNRSEDGWGRTAQSLREKGLTTRAGSTRSPEVNFITVPDLGKERLGLSHDQYLEMQQSVTLIIHNAWPVNFNSPLEEFEPAIAGTRRLCVDFAASGARKPHVVFISSIASALNYAAVREQVESDVDGENAVIVPEEFEADHSLAARQGYGESKHIASCILAKAAQSGDITATIIRVGQLAGAVESGDGMWNKHEWFPSLIATSRSLGKIPRSLGHHDTLDFVPVDLAARVVVDLAMANLGGGLSCFNLVNHERTSWREMIPSIQNHFETGGKGRKTVHWHVEEVELDEWLAELVAIDNNDKITAAEIDELYPAIKLLDFFQAMTDNSSKLVFATDKAVRHSETLRMGHVKAVDADMMEKWLKRWDF